MLLIEHKLAAHLIDCKVIAQHCIVNDVCLIKALLIPFSVWLWLKEPTADNQSMFNLSRDSVYGAVILLGIGIGMAWVAATAMVSKLVGKYTVSSDHRVLFMIEMLFPE